MATATRTTEFLINGEWQSHAKEIVELDTCANLIKRRGNIDLPHLKLSFSGGVMTEINFIRHLGDEAVVKTTTAWEK
jgi:hypothetical protein